MVSKKQSEELGVEAASRDIAATGPWEIVGERKTEGSPRAQGDLALQVEGLRTYLRTRWGEVKAVDVPELNHPHLFPCRAQSARAYRNCGSLLVNQA